MQRRERQTQIRSMLSLLCLCRCCSAHSCCSDFKGPPDPLRGDAPYARVREEAKECINAVFNGPAARQSGGPSAVSGRMEGYGGGGDPSLGSPTSEMNTGRSSNFGYEGTYSSSNPRAGPNPNPGLVTNEPPVSTGKMVGFGNPQYDNKTSSASFIDKMKTKMTAASSDAKGAGPYKPYAGAGGYANPSTFTPPPIAALDQSNGAGRKRGEVGGVWANGGDAGSASQGAGAYPGSSSSSNMISGTPYANSVPHQHQPRVVRPTSSNGEYETRLIDSLTPAAGVRSVPSKEELSKFAQQCESLDKLLVVKIINETKLPQGTPPATQMKALCLVECILTTGNAAATEEVEDYLCENAANLEALEREGSTSLLKNKAVRVMELCGLREEKRVQQAPTTAAAQPAASSFYQQQATQQKPEVDLLGFAAPAPAPAPAASASSGGSAFGFLDPSDSGSSNGGGNDMFGSLEVKQPSAASASAAPAASPQHDPFDLFTTPSSNNNTNKPAASPQSSSSASSASAPGPLDFMNSSASAAPSGAKVDPLTALMSNTRLSAHPQPRAAPQMQMQPPMSGPGVFGASGGMAGFAPRNTMPPLGPPQQMQGGGYPGQGYPPQQQQGGYPNQGGYAPQGYPPQQMQMQGGGFAPQQMGFQAAPNPAANQNLLFQVKAAGSNGGGAGGFGGSSQLPAHMRPSIELDSAGNPIVLGGPSSSPTAAAPGSSAFGFVSSSGPADSFGFVNDMMASNK